jgi:DNA-binding protein HU-beta
MNKRELISEVAGKTNMTVKQVGDIVDVVFESVAEGLKRGDSVKIGDFGTFLVKERGAREGRNPSTGETIKIPSRKAPGFKAAKGLKDKVND